MLQEALFNSINAPEAEKWASSFREGHHKLVFQQVTSSLAKAGQDFHDLWFARLVRSGFLKALVDAYRIEGRQFLVDSTADGESTEKFTVEHRGETEDAFGQPIDVFKICHFSDQKPTAHVASMSIATLKHRISRFTQPIGISIRFDQSPIQKLDMHFLDRHLSRTQLVSTDPNILFVSTREKSVGQYICFDVDHSQGTPKLRLEAGFQNDTAPTYLYENFGGSPILSDGVRVKGDLVEFFDIEGGEINSSKPLWLPGVLSKLANLSGQLVA